MVSIRTSAGIGPWVRPSPERSKITFVVRVRGRGPASGRTKWCSGCAGGPWTARARRTFSDSPSCSASRSSCTTGSSRPWDDAPGFGRRPHTSSRSLWFPWPCGSSPLSPGRLLEAFEAHRKLFGKGGVYVRLPGSEPIRLRDTLLMSIGPFAIDVLVMAEILFLQGTADLRQLVVGFVAFPILLLAGLLTSLLPGAWLLDALDLRLVNATRGE